MINLECFSLNLLLLISPVIALVNGWFFSSIILQLCNQWTHGFIKTFIDIWFITLFRYFQAILITESQTLVTGNHQPTRNPPPTRSPSFSNRSYYYWEPVLMCGVSPFWALFRKYVRCPPPLSAPCSEYMCGVPPSRYKLFCAVSPRQFSSVPLTLSWILSEIENLASSSLQDEAKLN